MITELFGCPGCGKTYAIESLSHKGAYKNTTKTNQFKKEIGVLIKKMLLFTPCAVNVKRKIFKNLSTPDQYMYKYSAVPIDKYVSNIAMLASVYQYLNRELYIDEGLVHRVISMCINYSIPKENAGAIVESLSDNLKNVKIYYLDTPPEVCSESIIKRNRHEASIDFSSGSEIKKMLSEYYKYCEYISRKFEYKRIGRNGVKGEIR